jgi:hypothetical protein
VDSVIVSGHALGRAGSWLASNRRNLFVVFGLHRA